MPTFLRLFTDVGGFNPYGQLRAASGDLTALRALTDAAVQAVIRSGCILATVEALTLARLAASKGDFSDEERVLWLLRYAASVCSSSAPEAARGFEAERIARMSILADAGMPLVGESLPCAADRSNADAMVMARRLRELMLEA